METYISEEAQRSHVFVSCCYRPTSTAASTSCVTRSLSSPPAVSSSMAEKSSLQRTGSDGKEHEHKRTQLKHHNTWPTREPVSPRGPLKCKTLNLTISYKLTCCFSLNRST